MVSNSKECYANAYFEINTILEKHNFFKAHENMYLSEINDMSNFADAIDTLTENEWSLIR